MGKALLKILHLHHPPGSISICERDTLRVPLRQRPTTSRDDGWHTILSNPTPYHSKVMSVNRYTFFITAAGSIIKRFLSCQIQIKKDRSLSDNSCDIQVTDIDFFLG